MFRSFVTLVSTKSNFFIQPSVFTKIQKKMDKQQVVEVLKNQKDYFATQQTKDVNFRVRSLKKLKESIEAHEAEIMKALFNDLHKSDYESFVTEIFMVTEEIDMLAKNLKTWAKPNKVRTNLVNFGSTSYVHSDPYGHTLIIAPWNYPFQLLMAPLAGAVAAGNVVALKPSEYSIHTTAVMKKIVQEVFEQKHVAFFEGEIKMSQMLLEEKFDLIFFTGSTTVGRIVMQMAAKHLTPVVLELGGKSPVIIDKEANLDYAAKRLIWGKFINAGQTCLAPDYLFVHSKVKDKLLKKAKAEIEAMFGSNPLESNDYPRIITEANVERLAALIEGQQVYTGGQIDVAQKYVAPTLLVNVDTESEVMQHEIFGPILPVLEFENLSEVVDFVNNRPKPLALYYFSEDIAKQKHILEDTTSGGACINDVVMHISNPYLPFGGVGSSGIGNYHGKYSFETFSHQKAVMKRWTLFDLPVRYAPYAGKLEQLKKYLKLI